MWLKFLTFKLYTVSFIGGPHRGVQLRPGPHDVQRAGGLLRPQQGGGTHLHAPLRELLGQAWEQLQHPGEGHLSMCTEKHERDWADLATIMCNMDYSKQASACT